MIYSNSENKPYYFPPLLSNGEIAFAPDMEGTLSYTFDDYFKNGVQAFDGIVVRVARRSALCNALRARLFPMGKFVFQEGSSLCDWQQELIENEGRMESVCAYADGVKIHSKAFIHPEMNVYALEKTFTNINSETECSFDVTLRGYNEVINRYMEVLYAENKDGVGRIGFKMYGMERFSGEIRFFVDKAFTAEAIDGGLRISFKVKEGEKVTFYYMVEDDLYNVDYATVLGGYQEKIECLGFSRLENECKEHFRLFNSLGYVKTSDKELNQIYQTSLYSIKCNTSRFSVAVGLNNGAWDGRYFAFDEYASYLGLLGANRLELAKRVPTYRLKTCLPTAIRRASDCHITQDTENMARFHWESGEYGNLELSPDGNWIDHIFHIPLVGIGAFNYYEYSGDEAFLSECYPMIRASAKFMTKYMIYQDGERLYVGKCTDLERLGSAVENPFMSCCGVIKLLECCAKSAQILKIDEEYAKECAFVAKKLYDSLPVENGKFVPHLKCKQKSIAVFAGKYPFDVLNNDNERMFRAWSDFEENESAYGNMYPEGKRVSPWYACWKAEGYARSQQRERAYECLKQAYLSAGAFGELFEINEPGHIMRPWFSTAAGIFVSAVNDMLVQSDGEKITILPGIPHTVDVAFKLLVKGAVVVEAEIKDGDLVKVIVTKNGVDVTNRFRIIF